MGTADFAKLAANRAELAWSDAALLGMLVKRIANTSDELAAYCRGARLKFEERDLLGLIPKIKEARDALPLLERLAGESWGPNGRRATCVTGSLPICAMATARSALDHWFGYLNRRRGKMQRTIHYARPG